jgi:hypothetical protein
MEEFYTIQGEGITQVQQLILYKLVGAMWVAIGAM